MPEMRHVCGLGSLPRAKVGLLGIVRLFSAEEGQEYAIEFFICSNYRREQSSMAEKAILRTSITPIIQYYRS